MYMSVIFFTYTRTNQILLFAGLFGNYPSSSILHWSMTTNMTLQNSFLIKTVRGL